ncbi:MAG TPA: hypothetical protein VH815_06470 [Acidobacteriota bacterium]
MTTRNREDVMGERVAVSDEQLNDQRITTDDMAKTQPTEIRREEQHQLEKRNEHSSLLPENVGSEFRSEWDRIQVSFVDEPRKAVEQADSLVAQVMQHVARTFSDERKNLEGQWSRGDNVSTEDLRIALQRYRTFFSRLLSV